MKIYFVRHGETKDNRLRLHQTKSAPLSEAGIRQADILAKRLAKIPIDIIYSSQLLRAKQTAKIINKATHRKIIYSKYLDEWRGPQEFIGKEKNNSEVKNINKIRNFHGQDPDWHYSNEENFLEYKNRINKFLLLISKSKKNNILVVTHVGPIKMLLMLMTGKKFLPQDFYKFSNLLKLDNTGITLCNKDKNNVWTIQAYNDYSHLQDALQYAALHSQNMNNSNEWGQKITYPKMGII